MPGCGEAGWGGHDGRMPTLETTLRDAAFGGMPSVGDRTLAAATTPRCRLLAAIVLGARGRYAASVTLLTPLLQGRDPLIAALAGATVASHRRQLGGHAAALPLDGSALRRAMDVGSLTEGAEGRKAREATGATATTGATAGPDPDGLDAAGAVADALLGLAADNLGLGRLTAARRLLRRAVAVPAGWRAQVRAGWVTAELALASSAPQDAVAPAERAAALARDHGAVRHTVKSDLVLGAALAATGDPAARRRATALVRDALGEAVRWDLRSLVWPAGLLAAELDPDRTQWNHSRVTRELHSLLPAADPVGRCLAAASPWVPTRPLPARTRHTDIRASSSSKNPTRSCQGPA